MELFNPLEKHAVAFDIDGIFLDTATAMWEAYMNHFKIAKPITDWVTYNAEDILGVSLDKLRPIYEPILARSDLPALKGAAEVIDWLYHMANNPVLFITARREKFCKPAENSIRKAIEDDTDIKVICNSVGSLTDRFDKLDELRKYNVKFFMEDHDENWERYMDAGIHVGTLLLPWTKHGINKFKGHPQFSWFKDWEEVGNYLADSIANVLVKQISFGS